MSTRGKGAVTELGWRIGALALRGAKLEGRRRAFAAAAADIPGRCSASATTLRIEHVVKVIASSLRKGNVVEIDGKLYVVLSAENIHPGKGTPVTQIDMRRISDGVKVSERYRTTEQVERAHVEDREHTFLYQDGEGFHFMNPETYDQITVPADVVGDQAPYLAARDEGDALASTRRRRSRSSCRSGPCSR